MIVTNNTAEKLKSAGFQQPEPERGQFWWYKDDYMGDEYEVLVLNVGLAGVHFDSNYGSDTLSAEEFSGLTYMPTATDILREVGPAYIFFHMVYEGKSRFYCNRVGVDADSWSHENPAKACALAWLEKNNNQSTM